MRRTLSIRQLALLSLAAALGASGCCSSSGDNGDGGGASNGGASNGGTNGAGTGGVTGGATGASNGGNGGNCADGAQWIYTIDQNDTLSAFHPDTLTFDDIGTLTCQAGGASPSSMAVDRNAVAWVLYSSGAIFQVDTGNASCTATSYQSGQHGLLNFGMGFSSDQSTPGANDTDTLFIAGGADGQVGTATLATIAFPSLTVTPIGGVTGWPELTGTGDGELWGFAPSNQGTSSTPILAQIDKTSGSSLASFQLASIAGNPYAWSQGFYGGAFFIFLRFYSESSSDVYEVQRGDGGLSEVLPSTGRTIVGAGVSTCAPVTFE